MTINPFNDRTAYRLRAIIGAKKINLSEMGRAVGKSRVYISQRLNCGVAISTGDLELFGNYLGYTPEELVSEHFQLHEPLR